MLVLVINNVEYSVIHRTTEGVGDSGGLSCSQQGSTLNSKQVTQGVIHLGLENIQGWKQHSHSGQLASILDCLHRQKISP